MGRRGGGSSSWWTCIARFSVMHWRSFFISFSHKTIWRARTIGKTMWSLKCATRCEFHILHATCIFHGGHCGEVLDFTFYWSWLANSMCNWITSLDLAQGRSWISDLTHKTLLLKHIFARVWAHFQLLNVKRAELIAVNEKGEIVASLQDPTGSQVSFATGAVVRGDYLYISSLTQNYISRINLNLEECSLPKYSHWPLY